MQIFLFVFGLVVMHLNQKREYPPKIAPVALVERSVSGD